MGTGFAAEKRVTERETAFGLTRAYQTRVEEATGNQVKPIIRHIN